MGIFDRWRVVRRRRDGSYDLQLDPELREIVRHLLGQLDEVIETGADDPALRRLRPPAYLEDPERDAAYQLLAGEELRTARREAIATVLASIDAERLSEDQVWSWLRALNAIRLVVGTRLDVSEDVEAIPHLEPDDPALQLWAIYELTSRLQHELVQALQD